MNLAKYILLAAVGLLGIAGTLRADINSDPWQFNAYTLNNLGTGNNPYSGASVQGMAGSGGSAYLTGIGLNTGGGGLNNTLYTVGSVSLNSSSSYNGGISVGGTLNYNNSSVVGNVQSGGNLTGSSGSIQGNVSLQGANLAGGGLTITGTVTQNQPFSNPLNGAVVNSYFQGASSFWAGLPATATWANVYGQIVVSNLQAGRNVVDLTLANINSAYGIKLVGPANAFVVFNITDISGNLNAVTFDFSGGVALNNVLFNLPNSTSLTMSGGTYASVLAPLSTVSFGNGMLQGNFVAGSLQGSGSFSNGAFSGFAADQANFVVAAPEPQTYVLLATFLAAAIYLKRRRSLA